MNPIDTKNIFLVSINYLNSKNMFGKKLLTLAVWYVAWSLVTSLFNDKKWDKFKKELEKAKNEGKDTSKMVIDNFLDTQKNFIETLKKEVLTDENIKYMKWKKEELESLIEDYKIEWFKLLEELQKKWEKHLDTAKSRLEELYNEKMEDLSSLKWEAPEKVEDLKVKLLAMFEEFTDKLKEWAKKK